MNFFRRKNKKQSVIVQKQAPKAELTIFEQLKSGDDDVLTRLAFNIKEGKPIVINFELLEIDDANKAVAFLSGVVFGVDGEIYQFNNSKNIMFADKNVYSDGTMKELIKDIEN